MSTAAQIVAVAVVGTVLLVRLIAALHGAHRDGEIAARRSTQDGPP